MILDLHNTDYYYHVFTYPDFQYQSSFGKRGRSGSPFMRRISVLQGRTRCGCLMTARVDVSIYGIAGETPKQEKDILLDKRLFVPLILI